VGHRPADEIDEDAAKFWLVAFTQLQMSQVMTSAIGLSSSCIRPQRAARTDKAPSPAPVSSIKQIFTADLTLNTVMLQHRIRCGSRRGSV
jgi:hypothetical protein